jgi:Flp pilus assembly protein CpaB
MRREIWIIIGIVVAAMAISYAALSLVLPHTDETAVQVIIGEPTPAPTAQIVYVLIAARDVHRGQRIEAIDVTIMGWPITDEITPPLGALLAESPDSVEALEQVIGRIARMDIIKNQPMLDYFLTPSVMPDALKHPLP